MALAYEPERDFYKLLGLSGPSGVTELEVRQAYLKCARKAHPDRDRSNHSATENFQDIQQAYETLKDDAKRAKYNRLRTEGIVREETRKREEARKRENEERGRNRRRTPAASAQQFGPEKYFAHGQRAPKPTTSQRQPPPGVYSGWAEMGRANTGKFGEAASAQSRTQKPAPETKSRPHPTSRTPRKAAAQRPGSFANYREQMSSEESPPKNGYRPNSSTMGDEPRAKSNSYASTPRTEIPRPSMSGGSDTDSEHIEPILKGRTSQPYQRAHGERTKIFEGQAQTASSGEESRGRKPTKDARTPSRFDKANGHNDESQAQAKSSSGFYPNGQPNGTSRPKPPQPTLDKNATENMGSWFVRDSDQNNAFRFTAGGKDAPETPLRRSRSSGFIGRKASPAKRPRQAADSSNQSPAVDETPETPNVKFDPKDWSDIGPQTFIPRPNERTQVSPTRNLRSTLKKSTTSRPTATPHHATVSDEAEEPTANLNMKSTKSRNSGPARVDSPLAMDIDSPPPPAASTPTQPPRARAMPVEPSKPEWRAGKASEPKPKTSTSTPTMRSTVKPTSGGSEDTDEFRATFSELKNVPPFVPQGTGLSSIGDLKSSLPYTSQPSESIPIKQNKPKPRTMEIPTPPAAPMFPTALGSNGIRPTPDIISTYRGMFNEYLSQWNMYHSIMVNHFAERQKQMTNAQALTVKEIPAEKQRIRERKEWLRQDREVRKRWAAACEEHERRLDEHLNVLDKMGVV